MELALAAVLAGAIGRAFFGPPPAREVPVRAILWAGAASITVELLALFAVVLGRPGAEAMVAFAVVVLCATAWLGRNSEGDDDGGGGPPPDDPGPFDWDAFDRARAAWARRPRDPVA
jgi:uncharacterized membrane protein